MIPALKWLPPNEPNRLGSSAISLLEDFLTLDWRKRITAIDALNHPYFRNAPLPARPGDLPTYEDSHELDRRKFRGQKADLPPAPAGGTVGMGPNGDWAPGTVQPNGGAHVSGPPSRDHRGPGWVQDRALPGSGPRNHQGGSFENRLQPPPPPRPERVPLPHDEHRLMPSHESLPKRPGWQNRNEPAPRYVGPSRAPPQHSRPGDSVANGHRYPPSRSSNIDTYVPSYSDNVPAGRPPPRDDRQASQSRDDMRPFRENRDRERNYRDRLQRLPRDRDGWHADDHRVSYREHPPAYADKSNGRPYGDGSNGLPYEERAHRRTRSRSPDRLNNRDRERDLHRR